MKTEHFLLLPGFPLSSNQARTPGQEFREVRHSLSLDPQFADGAQHGSPYAAEVGKPGAQRTPFLPDRAVQVAALPEAAHMTEEQEAVFHNLGINTVIDDDRYDSHALALEASKSALEKAGLEPADLDIIILLQSRVPDTFMSSSVTRLQKDLGAKNAFCFTVTDLGCVGVSGALKIAKDMLTADESKQNVLLAYGSKPFTTKRFRYPVTTAR